MDTKVDKVAAENGQVEVVAKVERPKRGTATATITKAVAPVKQNPKGKKIVIKGAKEQPSEDQEMSESSKFDTDSKDAKPNEVKDMANNAALSTPKKTEQKTPIKKPPTPAHGTPGRARLQGFTQYFVRMREIIPDIAKEQCGRMWGLLRDSQKDAFISRFEANQAEGEAAIHVDVKHDGKKDA